jgi:hypothetical protein
MPERNANYYEFTVPTTDKVLLAANPHRRSLLIENPTNVAVNIRLDGAPATTNSLYLIQTLPPLYLDWEMFGRGIQREVHALAAGAGGQLVIMEGYD